MFATPESDADGDAMHSPDSASPRAVHCFFSIDKISLVFV